MENITVTVNYMDFRFKDINEAIEFGRTAKATYITDRNEKAPKVTLTVRIEGEDEEGEDD